MDRHSFMKKKYSSMLVGGTLSSMIVPILLLSNTLIAGSMIGDAAVAGINLVLPVYSFASFFAMLCSLGVPILYSGAIGRFQKDEADRIFATGITASLGCGALLFVLLTLFDNTYLAFYGASADVLAHAVPYILWMRWIVLLLPISNYLLAMIFADGDETLTVVANVMEAAGNLSLCLLLCRRLGTAGLGIGALCGLALSTLVCLGHFFRKRCSLKPGFAFSLKLLVSILRYSVIDAGTYLFLSLFSAGLNKYVLYALGEKWLILVSVINVVRELQILFDGIGEAITPMMSIYLSEDCFAGVRKLWRLARRSALLESAAIGAALFALSGVLPRCLGITDPEISRAAAAGLRMQSVSLPFISLLFLLTSYYLLLDRISLGFWITALRDVAAALPLALLGGWVGGAYGMLAGVALAPAAAWAIAVLCICLRHGRDDYPLLLREREVGKQSLLYDFTAIPERIISVRDELQSRLTGFGFSPVSVNRLLLVFEEACMTICERNEGRRVLCECSLLLEGTHLKLVCWDDGERFDLTRTDLAPDSLRAYVLSRVLSERVKPGRYLMSLSFNRTMFELEMCPESSS